MSFWNNPEYNTQKSLLIILLLVVAGFGIYKLVGSPENALEGNIYKGTKYHMQETDPNEIISCDYDAYGGGSLNSSCTVHTTSCNTYNGTTQVCPGDTTPGFGCCCVSSNNTCYPLGSNTLKDPLMNNGSSAATNVSGGGGVSGSGGTKTQTNTQKN